MCLLWNVCPVSLLGNVFTMFDVTSTFLYWQTKSVQRIDLFIKMNSKLIGWILYLFFEVSMLTNINCQKKEIEFNLILYISKSKLHSVQSSLRDNFVCPKHPEPWFYTSQTETLRFLKVQNVFFSNYTILYYIKNNFQALNDKIHNTSGDIKVVDNCLIRFSSPS